MYTEAFIVVGFHFFFHKTSELVISPLLSPLLCFPVHTPLNTSSSMTPHFAFIPPVFYYSPLKPTPPWPCSHFLTSIDTLI